MSLKMMPGLVCRWFGVLMLGIAGSAHGEYQLGLGYDLGRGVTLGGYFSTEYASGDSEEVLVIDDVALLVYGDIADRLTYMVELESVDFVRWDLLNDDSDTNIPPSVERLYGDYKFSDQFAVRFGKQITPIGYWNLQPINVLRQTTSNPRFSREMFPKFLTGIDAYGYTAFDPDLAYHVYLQGSRDLDNTYVNIDVNRHIGASLARRLSDGWQIGMSLGEFNEDGHGETRYGVVNARYDGARFSVLMEAVRDTRSLLAGGTASARAAYVQGELFLGPKHSVISRVEYFRDELGTRERILVLGYSYRPVYPVSLKIEYQWHSDASLDKVLASFSVLF